MRCSIGVLAGAISRSSASSKSSDFVCFFVVIKPENHYFASRPGLEVKPLEFIHSGRVAHPAVLPTLRYTTSQFFCFFCLLNPHNFVCQLFLGFWSTVFLYCGVTFFLSFFGFEDPI